MTESGAAELDDETIACLAKIEEKIEGTIKKFINR